jgi:hypothetical protein
MHSIGPVFSPRLHGLAWPSGTKGLGCRRGHARACVGRRGGSLADGSPAAEAERVQRGVGRGAPTLIGRHARQSGVPGSSPMRWGNVKAELRSGVVVLGGNGELRWTTVAGGKSWSTAEARRVRRSQRRRVGRGKAWRSPRDGGGSFAIRLETAGSNVGERTHGSGKSRGGGGLLRRASAYVRKGGEWWGYQRFVLDRAEREQGEGVTAWCTRSSEGGPVASNVRRW